MSEENMSTLSVNEKERLNIIKREIEKYEKTRRNGLWDVDDQRKYFNLLRDVLYLYEDLRRRYRNDKIDAQGNDHEVLRGLASRAIDKLGGVCNPSLVSLKEYDYIRYGPFMGVSNEGSATNRIKKAALDSPKYTALGQAEPIITGMAIDAERLGSVGEIAVGPVEYRNIRLDSMSCILTTTNVGTRANIRYFKQRPLIKIPLGTTTKKTDFIVRQAAAIIKPFLKTPDNVPRPITVFVSFESQMRFDSWLPVLRQIAASFTAGGFCDPKCHKLGLHVNIGVGKAGLERAKKTVDIARAANISEVSIDGFIRKEAKDKITLPGLLNFLNPKYTTELLQYAEKNKVSVRPRNLVDPDTVARSIAVSLGYARSMGLELAKYGLFPLTLDESCEVMKLIQSWFSTWTAAPALYVDLPIVDLNTVYTEENILDGIKKWLQKCSQLKIPVVLLDTADKDKKRKILKDDEDDPSGILTKEQVFYINTFSRELGINVLWAGGITLPQVFIFGVSEVFGIYVTTAASEAKAVNREYKRDFMLSRKNEPTYLGVYRAKLLLEAGFLVSRLKKYGLKDEAHLLEKEAWNFIQLINSNIKTNDLEEKQLNLAKITLKNWLLHFNN